MAQPLGLWFFLVLAVFDGGAKQAAALYPVVCDGYAWVLNALGKVVAFDLADDNKGYAPNETHPNSRGFLTTGRTVFVHQQSDGRDTLTAMEMSAA